MEILGALAYMHSRHIIRKDVKLDNILVSDLESPFQPRLVALAQACLFLPALPYFSSHLLATVSGPPFRLLNIEVLELFARLFWLGMALVGFEPPHSGAHSACLTARSHEEQSSMMSQGPSDVFLPTLL